MNIKKNLDLIKNVPPKMSINEQTTPKRASKTKHNIGN